jgi:hypothetical protein
LFLKIGTSEILSSVSKPPTTRPTTRLVASSSGAGPLVITNAVPLGASPAWFCATQASQGGVERCGRAAASAAAWQPIEMQSAVCWQQT